VTADLLADLEAQTADFEKLGFFNQTTFEIAKLGEPGVTLPIYDTSKWCLNP
jgi:hypothetical protein